MFYGPFSSVSFLFLLIAFLFVINHALPHEYQYYLSTKRECMMVVFKDEKIFRPMSQDRELSFSDKSWDGVEGVVVEQEKENIEPKSTNLRI
jgi:hypothetical protein